MRRWKTVKPNAARAAAILKLTSNSETVGCYRLVRFEVSGEAASDDDNWAEVRYGGPVPQ
jgi:hypothetical protein